MKPKKCARCGRLFIPKRQQTKYCSVECRNSSYKKPGYNRGDRIESYVKKYCPGDCVYRNDNGIPSCDYAVIEKEPRGCDVKGCTKYSKYGSRRRWNGECDYW